MKGGGGEVGEGEGREGGGGEEVEGGGGGWIIIWNLLILTRW